MMNCRRIGSAGRAMIWGMANRTLCFVMPIVVRTVLLYCVGIEYVGLNSLASSFFSFTNLGIESALAAGAYLVWNKYEYDKLREMLRYYRKVCLTVACVIMIIGLAFCPFLGMFAQKDVPNNVNIYIVFLIWLSNTVIEYGVFCYKKVILYCAKQTDVSFKVLLLFNSICYVSQIVVVLIVRNYYLYAVMLPLVTLVKCLVLARVIDRLYPDLKLSKEKNDDVAGGVEKDDRRFVAQNTKKRLAGVFLQHVGEVLFQSVPLLIISRYLGMKTLGVFDGYYICITAVFRIIDTVKNSIVPTVGNDMATEDIEYNNIKFMRVNFIYLWALSIGTMLMLVFIQPVIGVWQGKQNTFEMSFVICLIVFMYVYKVGDMALTYKEAGGLWWRGKWVPLLSGMISLTLSFAVAKLFDVSGVMIVMSIVATLVYLPMSTFILFKYYFKSIVCYKAFLLTICKWTAFTFVVCLFILIVRVLFSLDYWWEFAMVGFLCCLVGNVLLIVINRNNDLLTYWKSIVCKRVHHLC